MRKWLAGAAGIAALSALGLGVYSFIDARPQLSEVLAGYVPEARCDAATFTVVEQDDAIQDWRYVVRISGSDDCVESLRSSLKARGAAPSRIPLVQGLLLPGHTDTEHEAVAFDFESEPGTVIWTRDKT